MVAADPRSLCGKARNHLLARDNQPANFFRNTVGLRFATLRAKRRSLVGTTAAGGSDDVVRQTRWLDHTRIGGHKRISTRGSDKFRSSDLHRGERPRATSCREGTNTSRNGFKPTTAGADEDYTGTIHHSGTGNEVLTGKMVLMWVVNAPANTKASRAMTSSREPSQALCRPAQREPSRPCSRSTQQMTASIHRQPVRAGRPLTERAVNYLVKAAAKRAGVNPAASVHWLRHAHASTRSITARRSAWCHRRWDMPISRRPVSTPTPSRVRARVVT